MVKEFHGRIQGLEERLGDSERQRAVLERQLVHHSRGGEQAGGAAGGVGGGVGLAARLAAAGDGGGSGIGSGSGTDAVAEARKR